MSTGSRGSIGSTGSLVNTRSSRVIRGKGSTVRKKIIRSIENTGSIWSTEVI